MPAALEPPTSHDPSGAVVLRLVILWKLLKGALLVLVTVGLLVPPARQEQRLASWLAGLLSHGGHLLQPLGAWLAVHATPAHLHDTALVAAGTAALVLIEAIGLHYRRRWAAWLTVVATSLLIPVEVYQLFHNYRAGALVVLAFNLLIVLYLARLARHHASIWMG